MRKRVGAAVLACATLFAASTATAAVIAHDRGDDAPSDVSATWLAWGGETRFHFNPDALVRLGLAIERADGKAARIAGGPGIRYDTVAFRASDAGALEIRHRGRVVSGIGGGSLRHAGGLVLRHAQMRIDLRGFALRASAGTRLGIDIVDANDLVWFTADHAHYGFADETASSFAMQHMNLRLSAHFAALLGHPEWLGLPIGGLDFQVHVYAARAIGDFGDVCQAPWPNPPATSAGIRLVDGNFSGFNDDVYVERCSDCTPTSTDGTLVVDQDSSLQNAGVTSVAWYGKFTGEFPPYGYDQHPFLIWNLYRLDTDGRLRQIGASGVKHAFYTVNYNCACGGGHVLYPSCEDVYSGFNNDSSTDLGPRSEIIPREGRWGRCGSVYDADCDGIEDVAGGAQDLYQFRMNVAESELLPPLANGARYFQEYWYVARDDDAIYDAMGWREVAFRKSGADWSASLVGSPDFQLGPVIDMWVAPGFAPSGVNAEMSASPGRARIAVQVTDLGDSRWLYRYQVMNFDYAHAEIDPAHPTEPNLHVLSNHGFASFRVPVGSTATISALRFDDADRDVGDDWSVVTAAGYVTWTAPASGNTLDWGMMYAFELTADVPPADGNVELVGVATATEPGEHHLVAARVPAGAND